MGSKRAGTQTVTQKADPWEKAVPYLLGTEGKIGVLPEAQRVYQKQLEMTPYYQALQNALIQTILQNQYPIYGTMSDYYRNLFNQLAAGKYRYTPQGINLIEFFIRRG